MVIALLGESLTGWAENYQILAEAKNFSFVLLDYVVWGASCVPFLILMQRLHYVIDTGINGDMFLHVNNLS